MDENQTQTEQTVTTSTTLPPQEVVKTTRVVTPPVSEATEPPHKVLQKKHTIFRAYQIIWYVLAVIEILLAFRMLLKVLSANPNSGFTTLILALSGPFAAPFNGMFRTSVSQQGSVFEWSTIIAAAVYALVAFGIVQLIHMSKPVSKQEVEQAVDQT